MTISLNIARILSRIGLLSPDVIAAALGPKSPQASSAPDPAGLSQGGSDLPTLSPPTAGTVGRDQVGRDHVGSGQTDRDKFLARFRPVAEQVRELGLDPNLALAQAALESGWGRAMPGNALMGIKADSGWHGPKRSTVTHEAGKPAGPADFRAYASPEESLIDWARFLQANKRYKAVFGKSGEAAADAIAQAGYATDPDYARKLKAIMKGLGGGGGVSG